MDDYNSDPMIDYLDKLFGQYEDTSVVGSIKSSFIGTNKERQQMKVASEGIKALGSLAKAKIKGEEANENTINTFKNDAADLLTGNRATYTKVANDVETQILNK